jgi:2-amino-4-hydroxy-6-hydroxymethyldihydropteridine diphosphokinase
MNKKSNIAYIALGANLSNPKETFRLALAEMEKNGLDVVTVSSLWHSPAWPPGLGHPDYVNAVIKAQTDDDALALMKTLHAIEAHFGRQRTVLNAPRPLDLDIIDYGGRVLQSELILPHPRALDRPFVLLPLAEIASEWMHPASQETVWQAVAKLSSQDVLAHHVIERHWLKSQACFKGNQPI